MASSKTAAANAGGAGRFVLSGLRALFQIVRSLIGYLSFGATVVTGLTLLMKRDFAEAGLLYLAEAIGPFRQVYVFAQTIVAFWDAHVVRPIHGFIGNVLDIEPPIWAVEVGTLILFAAGPVLRALWTARAMRAQIQVRLNRYGQLRSALAAQNRELEEARKAKQELQKALDNKDWNRVKSAAGMAGSIALGVLGAVFGQTGGHAARNIQMSFEALKSSFGGWKQVEEEIKRLEAAIAAKSADIATLQNRINTLAAADGGLLARLAGAGPELAKREIEAHVRSRMRVARTLSRTALGVAAAVVLAYLIDWTL